MGLIVVITHTLHLAGAMLKATFAEGSALRGEALSVGSADGLFRHTSALYITVTLIASTAALIIVIL